jgi:hypothetical protein
MVVDKTGLLGKPASCTVMEEVDLELFERILI